MKFIKLIKTAIKSVKQIKKPKLWTLIYEFGLFFISALIKQYKFMTPVLKVLRVFRLWTIGSIIISFSYGILSEIFTFHYDYKYFIILFYGLFVIFREFIYEYYFDIQTWTKNLLETISNKLQKKVIESNNKNPIINQNNVDNFRNKISDNEFVNMDEVNKNNRTEKTIANSKTNDLRKKYRDYEYFDISNHYNMWTDWKFYGFALSLTVAIYCLGVHYDYIPKPNLNGAYDYMKTCSYDVYSSIKNWFMGGRGGNNPPPASSTPVDDIVGNDITVTDVK